MILPRQDQNASESPLPPPTTSDNGQPPNPTLLPAPSHSPSAALQPWQIVLIVIGALALLGLLGTLFICIRTRLVIRRGASTTRFEHASGTAGGEFTIDSSGSPIGNSASDGPAHRDGGGGAKRERRESIIEDAKAKVRRLVKKSRTRTRSATYPSSPTSPSKSGVDFGLAALRFGGGGGSSGIGEKKASSGYAKGKKGRRKSQNGIDMRIRSADDHADDENPSYREDGKGPFTRKENVTESGSRFAVGSAGSGSRLMSAGGGPFTTSSSRREEDGFVSGTGPGRGTGGRESEDWGYGDHSIAHTVRGSFEDAEEEERQRAVAQQHKQLGAAIERLAAESHHWPGHDRGRIG